MLTHTHTHTNTHTSHTVRGGNQNHDKNTCSVGKTGHGAGTTLISGNTSHHTRREPENRENKNRTRKVVKHKHTHTHPWVSDTGRSVLTPVMKPCGKWTITSKTTPGIPCHNAWDHTSPSPRVPHPHVCNGTGTECSYCTENPHARTTTSRTSFYACGTAGEDKKHC